ncbi:MAG: hypothetical protein PHY34_03130 [Patescibacteria group bacterium]|nr:hypothetical protein [Patescibacteria group bacterium]MDD5716131.1 hypothetical protein [Patescibacteria group bacterium]
MKNANTYSDIGCEEAQRLIVKNIQHGMTAIEAGRLRKHLRTCKQCCDYWSDRDREARAVLIAQWTQGMYHGVLPVRPIVVIAGHPTRDELAQYVRGELGKAENRSITNHLNGSGRNGAEPCELCAYVVGVMKSVGIQ